MSLSKCYLAVLLLCIAASGCSYTFIELRPEGAAHSELNLEDYAEAVFKAQNRLHAQIIELSVTGQDSNFSQLAEQWEQQLILACNELNGIALKRMRGERLKLGEKLDVRRSTQQCDHSRRQVGEAMSRNLSAFWD